MLSHHREVFFYSGYYYISLERKETLRSFSTEISADSQLPCVKDESEGVRDVELMPPEVSVFEDAVISDGRGTQRGEENPLEGNTLAGEAASQAGDSGNEAANKGDGSDVSSQTPQTSSDWPEQVHLV